ncbi:MAG: family 16 glycoside hydrolase, partial [Planctomycetota bacterium JB042]
MKKTTILTIALLLGATLLAAPRPDRTDKRKGGSIFEHALRTAGAALDEKKLDDAAALIQRAIERDPKSAEAWGLRARWAEAAGDRDELVFALHKQFGLRIAQGADRKERQALQTRLEELDPAAKELFRLRDGFVERLAGIADQYERERRPHSAIRVLRILLALDPENEPAQKAIERISETPDPSLAATAKPKDLLADVSVEWIREHDAKHREWKQASNVTRDNYVTKTNAGYEVMIRAAEAMEQINRFYRIFFRYGDGVNDNKSVPRITLHIFKNRDEYLELGIGPPVEWSGGHFTGSHVETYIGDGGFEECVTTLFHEAAHQFVSLATTAVGWLNEGLASFFEGTRILANGTVVFNEPANHRLFPLVQRLEKGWMQDHTDGLDPSNASATPETAPTFQIILENRYQWGPPWYAPTWGVVFFLYNYQDPADGRFIYRDAFHEFVNASGGRMGEGAVENFEKVVLAQPSRPTKGLPRTDSLKLPRKCDELNEVWKEWLIELAAEQSGKREVERPYLDWARYAIKRREFDVATEHFEKGYVKTPLDVELLMEFAEHLAEREKNTDRATKLALTALQVLESEKRPDERRIREVESSLSQWDPKRASMDRIQGELVERSEAIVQRYLDEGLPMMAMEVSWRLGTDLGVTSLFSKFEEAARRSQKSIAVWQLAYNEEDLEGWRAGSDVWVPYGSELWSRLGDYREDSFDFNFLTYDKITSGDFSMSLDVLAERGVNAFCGIVFGRKAAQTFHALVLYPGRHADPEAGRPARGGFLDLASFYGADAHKVWRHNPVDTSQRGWHSMRIDVIGSEVDVWFDDELVVTHDFLSVDVLRGGFGLITGPGSAKYRNIRFLARHPRDPGAAIERAIRMEKLDRQYGSGSVGGSWLRKEPPFPKVKQWAQGGRLSFDERGPVPTLLVFWSRAQNEVLPIDGWLRDIGKRFGDSGLEIVSIAQFDDGDGLDAYLEEHPFPGHVGVDRKDPQVMGSGDTFEMYAIPKFNLPRLVLLDIDQRVHWEGDPGLEVGIPWRPGMQSYLDEPLRELIERRKLKDLKRWLAAWQEKGGPALASGDLDTALPYLTKARELPGRVVPMVGDAQRWLRALENALEHVDVTAEKIGRAS